MAGPLRRRHAVLAAVLGMAAWTAASIASPPAWSQVARDIEAMLDRAAAAHAQGQTDRAQEIASDAYFAVFEASGMETAVRRYVGAGRAKELERAFGAVQQLIRRHAAPADLTREVAALGNAVNAEARELDRQGITREDLRAGVDSADAAGAATPIAFEAATRLAGLLEEAEHRYAVGASGEARALLDRAYFDEFEARGLEAAVGARTPARKVAIEAAFVRVRAAITARAPAAAVRAEMDRLRSEIRMAIEHAQGGGAWRATVAGALILVREGFEAILILTALVAYLVRAGHAQQRRTVYRAAATGVVASLLTALALRSLSQLAARHEEVLEGVSMLAAAAVLVYVSYWLTSRAEAHRWQAYLRSKIDISLGSGRVAALWAAAFLAVYREGAETVLFYQALLSSTPEHSQAILAGLGVGAVALVLLAVLLRSGAHRVPMHAFFRWTSLLLYAMAFVFAGRGVGTLQAAGVLPASPTPWRLSVEWLGVHATWESLALQGALLAGAGVALVVLAAARAAGDARESRS